MTTTTIRLDEPPTPAAARVRQWPWRAGLGAVAAVAVLVRWWPVHQGAGLTGRLDYDDGVYYAGAAALFAGRLPYDDFLLLHPPGMLLALLPFVGLGEATTDMTGFVVARLSFMGIGALNAVLVAYVVRATVGRWPGLLAGLSYALWRPAAFVEKTTELEPLVCAGLLGSALLVGDGRAEPSRRRALVAGAVLGIVMTVKMWAVVPLVVVAAWLALRGQRTAARAYVLGGAGAAAVVCLPFFLAAPSAMVRMVVLDQLARPDNGYDLSERLASMTGTHLPGDDPTNDQMVVALAVAALVVAATVTAAAAGGRLRLWAAILTAQVAVVLTAPVYFDHYAAYVAPGGVVVIAAAIARWAHALVPSRAVELHPLASLGAAAGVALGVVAVDASAGATREARDGFEWRPAQLAAVVADRGCVVADNPGVLIAADVLTRDARRGCPLLVDPTGLTYEPGYDLGPGPTPEARKRLVQWQHVMQQHLTSGDVVILDRPQLSGFSRETRALVRGLPLVAVVGRNKVYDVPDGRSGCAPSHRGEGDCRALVPSPLGARGLAHLDVRGPLAPQHDDVRQERDGDQGEPDRDFVLLGVEDTAEVVRRVAASVWLPAGKQE